MMTTRYTHPLELGQKHGDSVRADLERFASLTRDWWTEKNPPPRKPCPTCKGVGVAENAEPKHAGSCPECRGMRTVDMTDEDIRDVYRRLRKDACSRLQTTSRVFDTLVCRAVPDDATAADYLRVAREIARLR